MLEKNESPKLKKKRKPQLKIVKRPYKKSNRMNLESREIRKEKDEDEYCIVDCSFGKKYNHEIEMIGCDGCNNWYHPKCIKMSEEEYKRLSSKDNQDAWICYECLNKRNN